MSRRARIALALAPPALVVLALGDTAACGSGYVPPGETDDGAAADAAPEHVRADYDGLPAPPPGPRTPVHAELLSQRVDTMQLMFAAGEMQTSGEPFAQNFAGRDLADYDRYMLPPNLYIVNYSKNGGFSETFVDLFGFSTAVESYEYSKYHMNMVANQTGAGVSLVNGPLLAAQPGATPHDRLRARVTALVRAAGTDLAGFAYLPDGGPTPTDDFEFPGLWPSMVAYRSFDPSMAPDTTVTYQCGPAPVVSGYGGLQQFGNEPVPYYECDYNTLHLNDRVAQTEHVIGPGILGYTTWKEALWAIDFTGRLHDRNTNPVTAVAPQDMAQVGLPGNQVQAVEPPTAAPGVFIGSTALEGMWGLTMIDETDNAAAWLISSLGTKDGAALGGLPSVLAAIQYDYGSPLVWFPTAIGVTEDGHAPYPGVASLAIQDAASHSVDLAALAQGYSLFFGMTDARNVAVGQQLGSRIEFGGYPFAADDGQPDGEDTPHDRALGIMRVAFVDLDRIHADPTTGVVVDTARIGAGGAVTRGTTATTTSLAHVVVGLRHLLMACNAAVSQYGAPDGDPSQDALGILNTVPIHPGAAAADAGAPDGSAPDAGAEAGTGPDADAGATPTFSARVREVLLQQAQFVRDVLTQPDGTVANGATQSSPGSPWAAASDPTLLESQGAALRVLAEAWFLTHDASYQERAHAVATRLLTAFWSTPALMFRAQAGGTDDVVMTPERFAWLQQALREIYEVLWVPGDALLDRAPLERVIARVNKLYLNGWDDLNGDQLVDKTTECLGARMQMAEQALTGELGTSSNSFIQSSGPDRDTDCVLNTAAAKVGSLLASQVHFHAP